MKHVDVVWDARRGAGYMQTNGDRIVGGSAGNGVKLRDARLRNEERWGGEKLRRRTSASWQNTHTASII